MTRGIVGKPGRPNALPDASLEPRRHRGGSHTSGATSTFPGRYSAAALTMRSGTTSVARRIGAD